LVDAEATLDPEEKKVVAEVNSTPPEKAENEKAEDVAGAVKPVVQGTEAPKTGKAEAVPSGEGEESQLGDEGAKDNEKKVGERETLVEEFTMMTPDEEKPAETKDAIAGEDGETKAEDDKEAYIGDATWEERTWKEIVRLKEEMFWARIGGLKQ